MSIDRRSASRRSASILHSGGVKSDKEPGLRRTEHCQLLNFTYKIGGKQSTSWSLVSTSIMIYFAGSRGFRVRHMVA